MGENLDLFTVLFTAMAMCLQPAAAVYSWAPWRLQRRLQRRLQLRLQLVYSGVNATRGPMFTVFAVFAATPLFWMPCTDLQAGLAPTQFQTHRGWPNKVCQRVAAFRPTGAGGGCLGGLTIRFRHFKPI